MLGVVLALAANEWRQARAERALAADALESIREELVENRRLVAEAQAYHAALSDTLAALARQGAPRVDMRLFREGFINPAEVLTTAWEAARAADVIRDIDYSTVLVASHAYSAQERYRRSAENAGAVFWDALLREGSEGIAVNYRNLVAIIGGFWYMEGELLREYDAALAALGVEGAAGR